MNLWQMECSLNSKVAEELSLFLEEEVMSLSYFERDLETWALQMIFEPSSEISLRDKMKTFFKVRDIPPPEIKAEPLPQEDWVAAVYRGFPPLTIGGFYIYGSHIHDMPPQGLIPLKIDAATAFGSGQHESTEGCLNAITLLAKEVDFKMPLDMGCGSGILALAMASLWKVPVLACDNDPEAVRVTHENARLNQLGSFVEAQLSEGFSALKNRRFDIITANILAGPLCAMAEEAISALEPGGFIVLSGLLNRQAEEVIDTYRSVGGKLANQLFIGDWTTLVMRKKSHG